MSVEISSVFESDASVIQIFAQLHEKSIQIRKEARVINKERKKLEERIQALMSAAGQTELSLPQYNITIRTKETTTKRSASKADILENLAGQIGANPNDVATAIESMAVQTKKTKLSVVKPRKQKRGEVVSNPQAVEEDAFKMEIV